MGRTGAVTPVANLEPVQLSGTVVKRASLHNADIIESLDLHLGDMVYVEKGGEIIPKIYGSGQGRTSGRKREGDFHHTLSGMRQPTGTLRGRSCTLLHERRRVPYTDKGPHRALHQPPCHEHRRVGTGNRRPVLSGGTDSRCGRPLHAASSRHLPPEPHGEKNRPRTSYRE